MMEFKKEKCLIIAEIGINHNGNLDIAIQLIDELAKYGVDYVKFQTISEETGFNFAIKDKEIYNFIKNSSLSRDEYTIIKQRCIEKGVNFLSSAADVPAVKFLDSLGVSGYKVSSGNFTNFHLIKELSKFKKPVIFSTGMSTINEIDLVVDYIRKCKIDNFALTYCVSKYPAELELIDLEVMKIMEQRYKVPIGFSDHTNGIITSLTARTLGACIIEKHVTLDRDSPGPDHCFSLLPNEIGELVMGIRDIEKVMFDKPNNSYIDASKKLLRRVMYYNENLEKNHIIQFDNISAKRPYDDKGISPMDFEKLIGRKLSKQVLKDELIKIKDFYD